MQPIRNHFAAIAVGLSCLSMAAGAGNPARAQGSDTLTLYVDEGNGSLYGHVFIGLSDGQKTEYYGFYPQNGNITKLPGLGGAELGDDTAHPWDVRKSYSITEEGYHRAQRKMIDWMYGREAQSWSLRHACGDFAAAVTSAAGVSLNLPPAITGAARPELFGSYLRKHGGEERKPDQPKGESARDLLREARAHFQSGRQKWASLLSRRDARREFRQTEMIYRLLTQRDAANPRYVALLAGAQAAQLELPQAEANYRQAIRLEPSSGQHHADLAAVLLLQGHEQEAVAEAQTAKRLGCATHPIYAALKLN